MVIPMESTGTPMEYMGIPMRERERARERERGSSRILHYVREEFATNTDENWS
jgi:hypothetical protein